MGCCFPIMRWNNLWRSAPRPDFTEQQENAQEEPSEVHPIVEEPSPGENSTANGYGTMASRQGQLNHLEGLDIPKRRTLRTAERTEQTNVSPSSMHTYTPNSEIIPRNDVDFVNIGAQYGHANSSTISINVQPAESNANNSEPDYLAGVEAIAKEPPDEAAEEVPLTLEEKLWDARIAWPQGRESYFIPYDDIERLVTAETILAELHRCDVGLTQDKLLEKADKIVKTARKLFAALVCQTLGKHILCFLTEDLCDKDMPFVKVASKKRDPRAGLFRLESRRHRGRVLQCMADLSRSELEGFNRDQWWVLAPIFKESKKEHKQMKKVRHWEIEDNRVLPFIWDEETTSENRGGFSEVWAVRVHAAHQRLYRGTNPQNPNPKFAIKRLLSTKEDDFKREIEMLKAFSHHSNHHLVRLLATYRYRNRYHLVFPLAAANLRKYWTDTKVPQFSFETMKWSLVQCKGISSALMSIHEFRNSIVKTQPEPSSDLSVPANVRRDAGPFSSSPPPPPSQQSIEKAGSEIPEAMYGRHGDLKPENILWSWEDVKDDCGNSDLGTLLIADFGLMEFHRENTRSAVPADTIIVSPTYEPPDRRLGIAISRKYDIWSLGCVYLEFITWLVGGEKLLSEFPDARDELGFSGEMHDDTFFSIRPKDPKKPTGGIFAIVRPKVTQWISDLRKKPRYSEFISDFLALVENDMLRVKPADRISCSQLNAELAKMLDKANKNAGYLTDTKAQICSESPNGVMDPPPSPRDGSALPKRNSLHIDGIVSEQRPMSPPPGFQLNNTPLVHDD